MSNLTTKQKHSIYMNLKSLLRLELIKIIKRKFQRKMSFDRHLN